MLHKPDVNTVRLTELADFIEQLPPEKFRMTSWGMREEPRCICGWLMHNNARMEKDDVHGAAEMLGIDADAAHTLFCNPHQTKEQAVSSLRKLAVVGSL